VPRDDSPYVRAVGEYVTFLRGLKPPGAPILVSVIAGSPTPVEVDWDLNNNPGVLSVCGWNPTGEPPPDGGPVIPDAGPEAPDGAPPPPAPQDPQTAYPGIRFAAFLDAFAPHSTFAPICTDMSAALRSTAHLQGDQVRGRACLRGPIASADSCRVADVQNPGTPAETRVEWLACAGPSDTDCHTRGVDPACSHTQSGLLVTVRRSTPAAAGTHVVVDCLVE
jgi:hypothetical protein